MFYVYILRSRHDDALVVGHTANLEKHLRKLKAPNAKEQRHRGPFDLLYQEKYGDRDDAKDRAQFLGALQNRYMVERLVAEAAKAAKEKPAKKAKKKG